MKLDVDIEPAVIFPHMTSIDKRMNLKGRFPLYIVVYHCIFAELEIFNQFAFLPQTESDAYEPIVQLAQVG